MDLVGEMLLEEWRCLPHEVETHGISLPIPRLARLLHRRKKVALDLDRSLTRYIAYPVRAATAWRPRRFFHVADHSYAHVVHALPSARTGVFCHDLDAFNPLLTRMARSRTRSVMLRGLATILLSGLRSAAVVFYSTHEVGRALRSRGLVPHGRLVHAPYGVAPDFRERADPTRPADRALGPVGRRPFLLHVGNSSPRKRLDVLFEVFARLFAANPELRLVQQGAELSEVQRAQVVRLGIAGALVQPPKLERAALADLYRRATVVLVTSEAEGFGFPVVEALACGAVVVASDIPVLREVGASAALYAPVGDIEAWVRSVAGVLGERSNGSVVAGGGETEGPGPDRQGVPSRDLRLSRAREFRWERHARTILNAYRALSDLPGAQVQSTVPDCPAAGETQPG
jgi:glycosyltransferase involved in cell wall biosynthesis